MNNKIIAWNNDKYLKINFSVGDYSINKDKYNPDQNAKYLSRLIMYALPGNTVDLILNKIAEDLMVILKSNPDLLLLDYDIQNRIRCSLNELANIE